MASAVLFHFQIYMASVAQLVRASGCGSEGRGFDPHHSPQDKILVHIDFMRFMCYDYKIGPVAQLVRAPAS